MSSVFTFCYFLKLNFNQDCVYYTTYAFDFLIFCNSLAYRGGQGFGGGGLIGTIAFIVAVLFFLLGIFAIVQAITKNSSAASRKDQYVMCRMYAIYAYLAFAVIFFLWCILTLSGTFGQKLNAALNVALINLINAAILHGYHENFTQF